MKNKLTAKKHYECVVLGICFSDVCHGKTSLKHFLLGDIETILNTYLILFGCI